MSDYFGKDMPKLGFGLMRLPHKAIKTDIEPILQRRSKSCSRSITPICPARRGRSALSPRSTG